MFVFKIPMIAVHLRRLESVNCQLMQAPPHPRILPIHHTLTIHPLLLQLLRHRLQIQLQKVPDKLADIRIFVVSVQSLAALRAVDVDVHARVAVRAPANLCAAGDDVRKDPCGTGFGGFEGFDFVLGGVVDAEAVGEECLLDEVVFLVFGTGETRVCSGEELGGGGGVGKDFRVPEVLRVGCVELCSRNGNQYLEPPIMPG